jgi:predicted dinucleotide-binding enzyme
MRIAILGAGNVGGALGKGWSRAGHAIAYGVPSPADPKHRAVAQAAGGASVGSVAEAVRGADVIVLAVPYGAAGEALAACGDLAGRVVVDATNPLKMGPNGLELALGLTTSGGEHIASLAKGASVFKAMNQIGFEGVTEADAFPVPPAMFVAGDDEARKSTVMQLVSELGFDAVDAGGIAQSRLLEPLAMLWIHMAIDRKIGRDKAFAYVARQGG